jgi:hypothetical protein
MSLFFSVQVVVRFLRSQGLQSRGGGRLGAEGANTVAGPGGMLPRENFEIQSL